VIVFRARPLAGGWWAKGSFGDQAIATWAPDRESLQRDVARAVERMKALWIFPRRLAFRLR